MGKTDPNEKDNKNSNDKFINDYYNLLDDIKKIGENKVYGCMNLKEKKDILNDEYEPEMAKGMTISDFYKSIDYMILNNEDCTKLKKDVKENKENNIKFTKDFYNLLNDIKEKDVKFEGNIEVLKENNIKNEMEIEKIKKDIKDIYEADAVADDEIKNEINKMKELHINTFSKNEIYETFKHYRKTNINILMIFFIITILAFFCILAIFGYMSNVLNGNIITDNFKSHDILIKEHSNKNKEINEILNYLKNKIEAHEIIIEPLKRFSNSKTEDIPHKIGNI